MTEFLQPTAKATNGSIEKTLKDAGFGDILEQPRFVLYKKENRDGKTTKIPKQPNGSNACSTTPATWNTFATVYNAFVSGGSKFDGIGIILGDYFNTKIVGMDLDHVCDAFTGAWTNKDAEMAVAGVKTYGEHSISGTGVHYLFLNQDVPEGYKTRTPATAPFDLEIYEKGRYFTLSGDWISGHKIATDEASLKGICETYLPMRVSSKKDRVVANKDSTMYVPKGIAAMDITDALEKDSRFAALYNGARPLGNESSDDLALVNLLVRYLGRDKAKVQEAFLKSPHFNTKDEYHSRKCTERDDYLANTITTAIANFFTGYSYDDVGNSDMFVDTYHEVLTYVKEWESWAYWNGKYWEKNANLRAQELAKDLSDTFRAKTAEYRSTSVEHDSDILKSMTKHSQKMRESKAISAMVRLATSRAVVGADVFDSDAMLFNTQDGVYDMKNKKLMPAESSYFCTNIAGAGYKEGAECPKWKEFITKVLPNEGAEYLQICVGMAAVGKVYEEAMIFMIGNGSNGKSTIANILSAVFGTYAITLQPDVITATREGKTPPDFAEVRGKRIVFLSETEEGDRLSTKALKRLSSNETVAARRLYSMPETFLPTHTVFYSTNHKPRIGSGDYGTWRRIKNLPFEYKFSDAEKKTNFAEQVLAEESEGILNWVFEGAAKFIENGCKLTTPQFVLEATEEYKENEDIVGQFIAEKCVMGDYTKDTKTWKVGSQELYVAYKEYCKDSGAYTKSISDFNNSMSSVDGVVKINASGKKFWTGLRFKGEYEDYTPHSMVGEF